MVTMSNNYPSNSHFGYDYPNCTIASSQNQQWPSDVWPDSTVDSIFYQNCQSPPITAYQSHNPNMVSPNLNHQEPQQFYTVASSSGSSSLVNLQSHSDFQNMPNRSFTSQQNLSHHNHHQQQQHHHHHPYQRPQRSTHQRPQAGNGKSSAENDRLEARRKRNREAAQRCRRNRIETIQRLEQEKEDLSKKCNDLRMLTNRLNTVIDSLKKQIREAGIEPESS